MNKAKTNDNTELYISLAVYCISLFFRGIHVVGDGLGYDGWGILILGPFALNYSYAWLSNPIYFFAALLFFLKRYKWAFVLSLAAIIVGVDTFRMDTIISTHGIQDDRVESVGIGFYIWEFSFFLLAFSSFCKIKRLKFDLTMDLTKE